MLLSLISSFNFDLSCGYILMFSYIKRDQSPSWNSPDKFCLINSFFSPSVLRNLKKSGRASSPFTDAVTQTGSVSFKQEEF